MFTKLNLSIYDPTCFYVCSEPHWEKRFHPTQKAHDIAFLSNSPNMDDYGSLLKDFKNIAYDAHLIAARKLQSMFKNDISKVRAGFKRYQDMEVYRQVIHPETNPVGHAYGALETKARLERELNGG